MKSPAEIVTDLMNETPEQTEARRALAKAQRESIEQNEEEDQLFEEQQLSDEQQGYKDTGMSPRDFY